MPDIDIWGETNCLMIMVLKMERQRVSVFQFQFFQTASGLQWHFSSELKVDLQYINLIENWSSFQH